MLNTGSEIHLLNMSIVPRGAAGLGEEGGPWEASPEPGSLNSDLYAYPSESDDDEGEGRRAQGTGGRTDGPPHSWRSHLQLFTHLEAPERREASLEWAIDLPELRLNAERNAVRFLLKYDKFRTGPEHVLVDYDLSSAAAH